MVRNVVNDWQYYTASLMDGWQWKAILSAFTLQMSSFTGLSETLVEIFLATLAVDFILGVWVAFRHKRFRCYRIKKGVSKLPLWIFYLLLAKWGDTTLNEVLGMQNYYLVEFLAASIIFTEISSIIKNCQRLKLPIPQAVHVINNGAKRKLAQKMKEFFGGGDGK